MPGSPQPPHERGSRFAWCRAAGRRSRSRWSPCGSGRFAPCGPVRMAGRSRETARLGFACSAARSPIHSIPLERLHGRRRHRSALKAALMPSPTVPAKRAPGTPARKPLRADALRLAMLVAATARALRCAAVANRPACAIAPARCAPPRPAREPKPAAKKKLMPEISPQTRAAFNGPRLPFLR